MPYYKPFTYINLFTLINNPTRLAKVLFQMIQLGKLRQGPHSRAGI